MSGNALTGGLSNYYLAPVAFPQRKEQAPYIAECEDITEALKMTPDEFCEFKAIWRTAAARLGNGKPGTKAVYDAEKRLHYAGRSLRTEQRAAGVTPAEPEKVLDFVTFSRLMVDVVAGNLRMDVTQVGQLPKGLRLPAETFHGEGVDIHFWNPASLTDVDGWILNRAKTDVCPTALDELIDYVLVSGEPFIKGSMAGELYWVHTGHTSSIEKWRPH